MQLAKNKMTRDHDQALLDTSSESWLKNAWVILALVVGSISAVVLVVGIVMLCRSS